MRRENTVIVKEAYVDEKILLSLGWLIMRIRIRKQENFVSFVCVFFRV